ncbi:hypothetical protein BM1_00829 [Bipolaris maydis]|nr:hypothetical protein BM1_00829 [Bipolaris maydis]
MSSQKASSSSGFSSSGRTSSNVTNHGINNEASPRTARITHHRADHVVQGNHWCTRESGPSDTNSNPYHYSNRDGSYYYSNSNVGPGGTVVWKCTDPMHLARHPDSAIYTYDAHGGTKSTHLRHLPLSAPPPPHTNHARNSSYVIKPSPPQKIPEFAYYLPIHLHPPSYRIQQL